MNEVNDLLRKAWQKAYDSGVILTAVEFEITETCCGNHKLMKLKTEAELKQESQQ